MIEVSRLKDLNAAKLFLGFCIGTVGRRDFAVFPVQGQRGLRRLKRYFGDKMSVGAQMVVVLKAFVERCVSLVLGHPFEFSWLDVSQADVFHRILSSWWEPARSHARWIVHPIVVASNFLLPSSPVLAEGGDGLGENPHLSPKAREMGHPACCKS